MNDTSSQPADNDCPSSAHREASPLARYAVRIILAVAAIVVVSGLTLAYLAARTAIDAEHNYHATGMMMRVVSQYATQHQGRWPASRADLEGIQCDYGVYDWPKDTQELRYRIEIDLSTNPDAVLKQSAEQFGAIRASGPSYGVPEGALCELQQVIREGRTTGR
jgi:hypothetical protein